MKTKTTGLTGFFEKNKVFFASFLAFLLYHHLFILDRLTQEVNLAAYEFHAVDYSLGFCTKILPGAIYHLLVGKYEMLPMTIYVRVISILLMALLSLLVHRIFKCLSDYKKTDLVIFALLCLAGPCTFYYALQFEGCMDAYWLIFFLLCVLFTKHSVLRWGIPLLSFLMILVHEGAILCYIPLICLILLVKFAVSEDHKEKRSLLAVFVLTVAVSIGALGYFMLFNSANLKLTDESQLNDFFDSRDVSVRLYYEWYFFGSLADGGMTKDFFPAFLFSSSTSPLIQLIFTVLRQIYYTVTTTNYISPLPQILYSVPLFVPLNLFLIRFIKHEKEKLLRFLGLCFLLLPLLSVMAGIVFSNDVHRWFSHALIGLFVGTVCISCGVGTARFQEIAQTLQKHYPIIVPYIIGFPILMV